MNDMTSAFQALFASAKGPAEQDAIRRRYAESMLSQQGEDRGMMREDRAFARQEPSRQFDERTNLLRLIMGGGSPFGGQPQTAYGQGDGWQGGRFTGAAPQGFQMGGMQAQPAMRPAVDPMQKNLDNYLARLLGGR